MKKTVVVTKFAGILGTTGEKLLEQRAAAIAKSTGNAMRKLLQDLYDRKDALIERELNLTDLSVETTDSLRPGTKDYNPAQWVAEMVEVKNEKELLNDEIFVAEAVAKEYFGIEPQKDEEEEEVVSEEAAK